MKRQPYPKYKESGVEWLGEVPEAWEVWKLSHGFERTGSGTTPPSDNAAWYDGDTPWVTTSELRENIVEDTTKKVSKEAIQHFSALKIFPKNSLVIAMYGATIGRLGILGVPSSTNQACCVMFGEKSLSTRFMFNWLQAFREQVVLLSSGGGQPNISQDKIRTLRIACPTLAEQISIAGFLDQETGKIDTLVTKKRALIEQLKEKRTALISRTVTRGLPAEVACEFGLEPHTRFKDSGIEWLGEVPEGWEVKPIFRLSGTIQTGPFGSQLHAADYFEGGIPLINPAHIIAGRLVSNEISAVNEPTVVRLERHQFRKNDIVMGRRGEIGRCAVVTNNEVGWLCGTGSLIIRLSEGDARYFATIFRAVRVDLEYK